MNSIFHKAVLSSKEITKKKKNDRLENIVFIHSTVDRIYVKTLPFRYRIVCAKVKSSIQSNEKNNERIELNTFNLWWSALVVFVVVFCFCSFSISLLCYVSSIRLLPALLRLIFDFVTVYARYTEHISIWNIKNILFRCLAQYVAV